MQSLLVVLLLLLSPAAAVHARQGEPPGTGEVEALLPSPVPYTPAAARLDGFARRRALRERSLVANVPLRSIGPTVMSGRVTDVDVSPFDPAHFYVAYASGGLWKTTSGGTAFTPLFDDQAAMTIGDIAVDWRRGETIWVGTGENNASRSSYAGTGVYKSTDGGTTWQHMGLAETHHTGRILLHPDDPNTVFVAATGHLYSPNPERGVYRSTDGGRSWQQTLYVDDNTGAIDLVMDPGDPRVLYAAMWERARRAWTFVESGGGSGIYRSADGGTTWERLTGEGSGFPAGEGVGRIGLAVYPGNPDVLYALLDNQDRRPEEEDEEQPALTRDMLRTMTRAAFLEVSEEALEEYLDRNGFPAAYTAQSILEMVRRGELEPVALVEYLEDANQQLFETPVIGAEVYRSDDGGRTWRRTHEAFLDNVYYSYGYYFGEVRVAPHDPDHVYLLGVPLLKSEDGGRTFKSIEAPNVHVDHHALRVSPTRAGHLVNGNDGGVNVSFDDGASWFKANTPAVGQFYAVQVDDADPYNVYGGLQDNGVWYGPSTYEADAGWYQEGTYPYRRLLGGDGMQVEVDTRTNELAYTGFQFGYYFRVDLRTGERTAIKPEHELGARPYRYNWQTPIHLSRHNQDILYLGSNVLHRSLDRGDSWEPISGDLTTGGRAGDVPYGTLTTIDESPLRFGLLYAGSDDGLLHVSPDGGHTWRRISDAFPEHLWVSRVEASHHDVQRVYAALNGYRWDHFEPYLYRSDDQGATWQRIGLDLPAEPVNVLVEDPANEHLLYVGTDHGLYLSLDGGASFMGLYRGLPDAPVHDLKVQARAKDLVVGTHGRSLFGADVEHVQQLTPEMLARPLHLFAVDSVTYNEAWGERATFWSEPSVPEVMIPYFSSRAGTATLRLQAEDGTLLYAWTDEAEHGLNYAAYDLAVDAARAEHHAARQPKERDAEPPRMKPAGDGKVYLRPGTYRVEVTLGGETVSGTLEVKAPPPRERDAVPGSAERRAWGKG